MYELAHLAGLAFFTVIVYQAGKNRLAEKAVTKARENLREIQRDQARAWAEEMRRSLPPHIMGDDPAS